jgi:protein tyrosine phosphatase
MILENEVQCVHLHYSEWPDRSVPEDSAHVRQLLEELGKYERVAIHCSAGLGRSGVIGCLLWVMQLVQAGEEISVFECALRLREHRFGAIQNSEQYAYIYHFLDYLQSSP